MSGRRLPWQALRAKAGFLDSVAFFERPLLPLHDEAHRFHAGGGLATRARIAESLVFGPGVAERRKAYVYLLIDPTTDLVFYVRAPRTSP